MSVNGTLLPHGRAVGYVILTRNGSGAACLGIEDPSKIVFLSGNSVTFFPTLREAKRCLALNERADDLTRIYRIAPLAKPSAPRTRKRASK